MKKMKNNNAVILMSGGLDSLVSLAVCKANNNINVQLGLTFDYGQKSAMNEIGASRRICEFYGIEHKVITLDWLKEITNTALVSNINVPVEDFSTKNSAEAVWVPNRNSLFLNIAASFCDSLKYDYIVYGANREEANIFPDNTEEFRSKLTEVFKTSTLVQPEIVAPLINYDKGDIVKKALELSAPLELVKSCYNSGDKHCGQCESCHYLKKALLANNCSEYIERLF